VTGEAGAVAVVPLRDGVSGKSRLAHALDGAARRRVVGTLARHVVGTLLDSAGVARVVVVTADVAFAREVLAGVVGTRGEGSPREAELLEQPADAPGLNAALDLARDHVRVGAAAQMLVAHADLPALATDDVEAVLAAAEEADVVVATDRHDVGTNLLLVPLAPPRDFEFRFGPASRAAHVAEAGRHGLRAVVVRRPGTVADLDTIDDWADLPPGVRDRVRAAVGPALP